MLAEMGFEHVASTFHLKKTTEPELTAMHHVYFY